MKSILLKAGLLTTLSVGLVAGKASAAEMDWATKCLEMGKIQPKVNPDFQQINCLLTNAALSKKIPPEVVKAVAEKESSGWKQFDENGNAVTDGKGFGIMQVTDSVPDPERVKSDIIYNIDQGVKILNSKYELLESSSIPRIKDAEREIIENWYFPVMAYNGLKPVNSPIKRSDGSRNWMTYQDKVFNILEVQSFLGENQKHNILAHYPFEYDDFIYDSNSSENIKFKTPMPEYEITDGLHESVYMLDKGSFVKVIKEGAPVRDVPTTSSTEEVAQPLNTTLIWDGEIKYTEPYTSQNVFTWFHVTSTDGKTSGYISSAYIAKKKDFVPPVVTGVKNNAYYNGDVTITFDEGTALLNGVAFKSGTTVTNEGKYTLEVKDEESNTTTITFTIDKTKPVFSGAADTIIQVGSSFDSKSGVTVTDNVDGDLTSKIQVSGSVDNQKPGEYQLVYFATDSAGNTATSIRKITVIDSTKPVIYGTSDKKLNINSQFDAMAGVSAVDNVDGNLTKSIKITGIVDTKKKGSYPLTYTVRDRFGNVTTVKRTITVIDNIPPVIYGAGNKTININTKFNPLTGVTAKDNVDGYLTKLIKVTGTVNTKKIGTYTLTYTVTDYSGNKKVLPRKITVKDNILPVIYGATPKTIKLKSSFNARAGVTAKDNVDGNLTKVIKITGTVNTKKKGTYTLTYVVADKTGNKTTVHRKITVK